MIISLSDDRERQIRSLVQEGRYGSADEVIEEALRLLDRQRPVKTPMTEAEFDQHLLDSGLMSGLPDADADFDDPDDRPIEITGDPLSETVIRDRRDAVVPGAVEAINAGVVVDLSENDARRFLAALDDDTKPNDALKRAERRYRSTVA